MHYRYNRRNLLLVVLSLVFSGTVLAQSTSRWTRIADASFGDTTTPSAGAAYMTLYLRAATVYQHSNWWTNFVQTSPQAVLTINLSGTIAGISVSQTKTGDPVELHTNHSMVDLGFSGIVVDHLPMTFSGLTFNLQINKTAKDGLQDLITEVATLSSEQPPVLSISQQAMGIASFSKSLADFLFRKNLLVREAEIQSPIPASGILQPGVYVCFAGDSEADYDQYLAPGTPGLQWSGSRLTYNGNPVQKVSYFVIEVGYNKRVYAQPLDVLSSITLPWVQLYLLAEREVTKINTCAEADSVSSDILSHLTDASALLYNDPDLINDEKDDVYNSLYKKINAARHDRLVAIGLLSQSGQSVQCAAQAPVVVAGPATQQAMVAQPAVRPNLQVVDPNMLQIHTQNLQQIRAQLLQRMNVAH